MILWNCLCGFCFKVRMLSNRLWWMAVKNGGHLLLWSSWCKPRCCSACFCWCCFLVCFASFQTLLKCDLWMFGPLSCRHLREQVAQCLCRSHWRTSQIFPAVLEACASQHLTGCTGKSEADKPHAVLVPAERDTESKHHYPWKSNSNREQISSLTEMLLARR